MSGALLLAGAGTLLSAFGNITQGNAAYSQAVGQKQAADYEASVLNQQATQAKASAIQQATIYRLNTQAVLSKQRAAFAASGGSATAPGAVTVMGQTAARGEYDALSALYSGEEKARGLQNQALLDVYMGEQDLAAGRARQQAGYVGAATTLFSGIGSLAAKYGDAGGFGSGGGYVDNGGWD